jgi:predicted lipid-binding transport protein (Tim44 family)
MQGSWKHIAASASITAVFIICALALTISTVPVTSPPLQASQGGQPVSLAASFTDLVQALGVASETAAAEEPTAPAPAVETAAQLAPATAAPAKAAPSRSSRLAGPN